MDKLGSVAELEAGARRPPRSLGMWAVLTGVVTAEQLQEAYANWDERGEAPGEMFVRNGWMTEQMVADALSELSGLPVVQEAERSADPEVLAALSAEEAWRLEACPLERDGDGNLVVALADPSDARVRALKAQLGADIRPVIVVSSRLKALLESAQESGATSNGAIPSRTADAEGDDEAETEAAPAAPSPEARATDVPDTAPEPVDSEPPTIESGEDPAAAGDQLERLHERLVLEHVQATDELVSHRRRFTELAEEQAVLREEHALLERSIIALEAKLGEGELVLSLIKAKLTELGD